MVATVHRIAEEIYAACSIENLSNKLTDNEYKISAVAYGIFATIALLSSGGSISLGYVVVFLIKGACTGLAFRWCSGAFICITKFVAKSLYRGISDSTRERAKFNASIDNIHSNKYFDCLRSTLDITSTSLLAKGVLDLSFGSLAFYNTCISISLIAGGALLTRAGWMPRSVISSYESSLREAVQAEDSVQVITRTIENHRSGIRRTIETALSIHDRSGETRGTTELREFNENTEASMPEALQIIARESLVYLFKTVATPGSRSPKPYPNMIPNTKDHSLRQIHRLFNSLTPQLKSEVLNTINSGVGPVNSVAHGVWQKIRNFASESLLQGNTIFNSAVQQATQR